MSVFGKWFITPHAIQRYSERVERGCTTDHAMRRLVDESMTAKLVRELPNRNGQKCELWRGRVPHKLRFIIVHGMGDLPTLVTIKKGTWPPSNT